eukprot:3595996-Karenia_brevis.AAC.1
MTLRGMPKALRQKGCLHLVPRQHLMQSPLQSQRIARYWLQRTVECQLFIASRSSSHGAMT